jgi:hypothetical protein
VNLPIYTNSEIKTWRTCGRKHFYSYQLGYRTTDRSAPLELGDLVHVGLEAWLFAVQCKNIEGAYDAAADAIEKHVERLNATPKRPPVDELLRVQAEELLLGYHCRWADEPIEVLAIEKEFVVDVLDPVFGEPLGIKLSGKLDGVVRVGPDVLILEHKTTSFDFGPGSHYWERTRLDSQVGLYFLGARSLGFDPIGCLYDVIGKPKSVEPKRATPPDKRKFTKEGVLYKNQSEHDESPEEYRTRLRAAIANEPGGFYARARVVRTETELGDSLLDLVQTVELMKASAAAGHNPRNVDSCFDFNRRCEFFEICTRAGSLDDAEKFRKSDRKHEELGA